LAPARAEMAQQEAGSISMEEFQGAPPLLGRSPQPEALPLEAFQRQLLDVKQAKYESEEKQKRLQLGWPNLSLQNAHWVGGGNTLTLRYTLWAWEEMDKQRERTAALERELKKAQGRLPPLSSFWLPSFLLSPRPCCLTRTVQNG